MPNRIIKESICESEGLSECSMFAIDLYKRLITYADDYGRFNSDTQILRARLYPREYEDVTEEDIITALSELAGVGKIYFYTAKHFNQGENHTGIYGVFPNWSEHQRVRDSKTKCPEPGDTEINDWYLRRFIPMDMRVEIIERDGFKCKICGKFLTSCRDARRFVKLGQGLYHIDHIVPVVQGGRATLENLRLICPECNQKRKKRFSFREILDFDDSRQVAASCGDSRQVAASCGDSRQVAASCGYNPIQSNPIQSESEYESTHARAKKAFGEFKNVFLTQDEYEKLCSEYAQTDEAIEFLSEYIARKGYKAKSHYLTLKKWVFKALDERKSKEPEGSLKSFDTDEFFEAALKKSYK